MICDGCASAIQEHQAAYTTKGLFFLCARCQQETGNRLGDHVYPDGPIVRRVTYDERFPAAEVKVKRVRLPGRREATEEDIDDGCVVLNKGEHDKINRYIRSRGEKSGRVIAAAAPTLEEEEEAALEKEGGKLRRFVE